MTFDSVEDEDRLHFPTMELDEGESLERTLSAGDLATVAVGPSEGSSTARLSELCAVPTKMTSPAESLNDARRGVRPVPNMSPEQVNGCLVNARTGIGTLGVTLYEMTMQQRPSQGGGRDRQPHAADQVGLGRPTRTAIITADFSLAGATPTSRFQPSPGR